MIYKDHRDVYHFFMEGIEQKLLKFNGHKTIELLLYKMNHTIIFATLINFDH